MYADPSPIPSVPDLCATGSNTVVSFDKPLLHPTKIVLTKRGGLLIEANLYSMYILHEKCGLSKEVVFQ